jgi:aryl-alcohol dehydrogenase-like predicted oxidoreductase
MIFTPLGLGTSQLASFGKGLSTKEAMLLFNCALENDVKLIDTSNTYGSGDSERLIARSIQGRRQDFTLMTKAGFPYVNLPGILSPVNQVGKKILQKLNANKNYSKQYLIKSLEDSLVRLKTDYVDVFLLHEPLYNELIQHDDCWEALFQIKKRGLAANIGISTSDINAFVLGVDQVNMDVVQTSMSYLCKSNQFDLFKLCFEKNVQVVTNQVLKPSNVLKNNIDFLNILKKYDQTKEDIIPILIAYAKYFVKSDCILVGTKNPKHLSTNSKEYKLKKDLIEIFQFINSNSFC